MPVDQRALLADLQKQVRFLEDDIRDRAESTPAVSEVLASEHARAVDVGRTAFGLGEWRDSQVTQAAVAWVLACVFVRFCEDNLLVDDAWITGPGERFREAGERQTSFLVQQPHLNDRDWLLAGFADLSDKPAVAALFDRDHNPLYRLAISADGAEALLAFWRRRDDDAHLVHDFTDPELSTRFLGDLYQDLSEAARKAFALLQTPDFVEELILDLTLDPAIETFGLADLKLIDPTCGSGHFLLGAFDRLLGAWTRQSPGMDVRERVQNALLTIYGVDVNPFATAIAKFRLTVAAMKACRVTRLVDAPGFELHVGTGDSLLYGKSQGALFDAGLGDHQYAAEDLDQHPGILRRGRYHAVVGNPPYITVKDPALNSAYRIGYESCHRQYALSVPFAELFFRLAKQDQTRPGFVGQITSNSFMKREFGTKLVGKFLPQQDLTHVLDTSGAYIPGHGTPTVVLIGRRRMPRSAVVRAVLGIRGEPGVPQPPSEGRVWSSIRNHLNDAGFENEFVSVSDIPRARLAVHPWSLTGGGADELLGRLDSTSSRLSEVMELSGRTTHTGVDDAFFVPQAALAATGLRQDAVPVVLGEDVRDYVIAPSNSTVFPYNEDGTPRALRDVTMRYLWPNRTLLNAQLDFGRTREERGLRWVDHSMFFAARYRTPLSIAFAFVATHNHFVLDRGGKVFKQSAPVIKLSESATVADHLALLGVLNSSTACFWLKQVSHNKGSTVDQRGARQATIDWENFYEFTGTKLQELPLPDAELQDFAPELEERLNLLWHHDLRHHLEVGHAPSQLILQEARLGYAAARQQLIGLQEEQDWDVYRAYGLVEDDFSMPPGQAPALQLGERAFEIVLARRAQRGEADLLWFERHRSTPITEVPDHWSEEYQALVERRIELIGADPQIRLLERPDCKRRWADDPWEVKREQHLRRWLLQRLETKELWHERDGRPRVRSVAQVADDLSSDPAFLEVLELWAGRSAGDVATQVGRLVSDEHVPSLATLRYKSAGVRKRADWELTWDLQRRQDAGEDVGTIAVPPRYTTADFAKVSYWRHRGKLDVPKERFISYQGAERGADTSLVLGWAGWDHAEQAMALATLVVNRQQQDGWDADRLTPLLAGLAELEPWVQQWHGDMDPRMGMSPAQSVTALLEQQLARLQLTRADLAAWRPPAPTRGRRPRTTDS